MNKKDKRFEKTIEEFDKLRGLFEKKIVELLKDGTITIEDLEFDYYGDDNIVKVEYKIKYPDGSVSSIFKDFRVELQLNISEAD